MAQTESGFFPQVDFTARDFNSIKDALVGHVQNFFPNDFQDFTESNLGIVILELVAYVGDQLSFYLDRQANEAFLVTAVQRQNVINLAALVGYVPRTTAAAITPIQATLAAQVDDTVIATNTQVIDNNGTAWEFLENISIPIGRTDTNGIQVTNEVLGQGDGATIAFSFTTANDNIVAGTVLLSFTIAAVLHTVSADTDGSFNHQP